MYSEFSLPHLIYAASYEAVFCYTLRVKSHSTNHRNMRNKILLAGVVAVACAFAGSVYAAGPNGTAKGDEPIEQRAQVTNQGGAYGDAYDGVQVQAEVRVGGEERGERMQNQASSTAASSTIAEQRRSKVANAVQEMLQVAEQNGSIGEQVRVIAQEQNKNHEKLEASLKKIQGRSVLAKFFLGADYKELTSAEGILEQNREQIQQLNELKNQITNQAEQQKLIQQIQALEEVSVQIETYLKDSEAKFSLFGWLVKRITK